MTSADANMFINGAAGSLTPSGGTSDSTDDASEAFDPEGAASSAWQAMATLVLDNNRRKAVAEATGVSFGRMRALRRIAREPLSMRDLAAKLGVDPPNLTGVVDDLERSALVERRAHPSDRRVKLVVATAAGIALAARAEEVLARPPDAFRALSADDLATLARILSSLTSNSGPGGRHQEAS